MLLECIGVRGCKSSTECDHHQGLGNAKEQGDRCSRENCGKREKDGDFVLPLKDGDQKFLAVKGDGIHE